MKVSIINRKGSGNTNEDFFCANNNTFGVFDGAASLNKFLDKESNSGGFLASHKVAETFMLSNKDLVETVEAANMSLRESMLSKNVDISRGVNRWSTTLSVVRINENNFDWVNVGDSVIISINRDGSHKVVSPYHNHDVEVLKLVKSLSGQKIDNLWEYEPFIQASTILQNNRNVTYGVLDGSVEALKFIDHGTEPLECIKYILLLTDGCYIPKENPDGSEEFGTIVEIFKKNGPEGLYMYIRKLQHSDKKLWKYPRFKQSDDFTLISLEF
ncbi:MAG: PP2C family serine/threonine-protein phosphatase [Patescibacteria group bacterium]